MIHDIINAEDEGVSRELIKGMLLSHNETYWQLVGQLLLAAQRQESEKNAASVGLENLSRNAGYSESIRLSWAMEAQAAEAIMNNKVVIDDVTISLMVDEQGKAQLMVNKKGKNQKSIPVKLRKNTNPNISS